MRKLLIGLIVGATFAAYVAYFRGSSKDSGALSVGHSSASSSGVATSQPATPPTSPSPSPTPTPSLPSNGAYKNGTYNGSVEDAFYGNVLVQVQVGGGRITAVNFLQYPNDRDRSIAINDQAMPILSQEAIDAQSANVDGVSGASDTSGAFIASLQTALSKAKA